MNLHVGMRESAQDSSRPLLACWEYLQCKVDRCEPVQVVSMLDWMQNNIQNIKIRRHRAFWASEWVSLCPLCLAKT